MGCSGQNCTTIIIRNFIQVNSKGIYNLNVELRSVFFERFTIHIVCKGKKTLVNVDLATDVVSSLVGM